MSMALIRLLVFNLISSLCVVIFFYFQFDLRFLSIPIHVAFMGYGLAVAYISFLLLGNIFPDSILRFLIPLLIILGEYVVLVLYLGFYIGLENWGHPLTIDIFLVYLKESDSLLNALPIAKATFLLYAAILFSLSLAGLLFAVKGITSAFNQKKTKVNLYRNLIWAFILLFVFPFGFFNAEYVKLRIDTYRDPFLSFFLYTYKPQGVSVTHGGKESFMEKEAYPSDLSFNKKNVILIIVDALRADHISSKGYERKTTPFLDSLSALDHVIHPDNFYATSSRSFVGISNILSANYSLSYSNFYIHDLLKKQGYEINFILSGDHTSFYGLKEHYGKSVDTYFDGYFAIEEHANISINDDRKVVMDHLENFPKYAGSPSFFYLHYMTVHQNGVLDPSYEKYRPNKFDLLSKEIPSEVLINDYDNKLMQLDAYLKETVAILDRRGYLDNAILVITGDHGQALGENGLVWHRNSTYLSETLIPLILLETGEPDKKLYSTLPFANQVDIGPSIIDMLGLPIPKTWMGYSMWGDEHAEYLFQQEVEYSSSIFQYQDTLYQYVYNSKTKEKELFNITEDKDQLNNIIAGFDPAKLDSVKKSLSEFYSLEIK